MLRRETWRRTKRTRTRREKDKWGEEDEGGEGGEGGEGATRESESGRGRLSSARVLPYADLRHMH
jgi:hypothetical protein